ncbi:MAG: type I polyketide synthase [Deltaproteobacteria bacterium]|nr:type I polyketide synthase [Deltaproteobacteria bacterium]
MDRHPLIAVVGMDGIFPGAPNLDVFWQNIVNGIDQSAPVPENRWIAPSQDRLSTTLVPDRPYSRHACLINDFTFDPGAFTLDPDLTRHLDPLHQLTLTAGKRAIHSCITAPVDYHRVDTILAAIALPTDSASAFSRHTLGKAIERRLFSHGPTTPTALTRVEGMASRVDGLPAALLAAEMGFGGDSFTLDAACASSIYAVKLGCNALAANRADMVVTGGVSRPECLYTQTGFSQLQALSASGRCSPFDRKADGLVVGEGVGILVLKRLADALKHGDTIHGVIHGVGLSNDMRGNLLAPESRGQVRAMEMAYRSAGWQPSDVDHIECHGTGTRAGDTTEVQSLVQLWKGTSPDAGVCAIGSVKSMIGHLLTAAGAAGMIKTLLAINHQTLPTSINYEQCPPDSPLNGSPFKVQTQAVPWKTRAADIPRRAAVSAFGFGGINAHILFEEWPSRSSAVGSIGFRRLSAHEKPAAESPDPVAIVGMDVTLGSLTHLGLFEKAVFQGHSTIADRPRGRWKGADATFVEALGGFNPKGAYIDSIAVNIGEFQIPPNEINDILPQQLLALKVGAAALTDAGLPLREPRKRMGVVVGLGFDFEATNFHLRWQLFTAIRRWNASRGLNMDDRTMDQWMENLRDQCGPPLTPPRVMGALGGIVASRMAREFRFGGPSFVVSADAASGVKALQVAVDLLQQNAADAMLVGAVDLAAEGRSVVRMDQFMPLSRTNTVRPFDASADGTLPGDGAVALVLKPLAQARIDGDRVYAVIRGIGSAGGDDPSKGRVSESTYSRSLSRCFNRSDVSAGSVSYVEAHGAGIPDRDRMEITALADFFRSHGQTDPSTAIALGSTKPITGFTGAADSLVALAKTALCLHHRILPPFAGFTRLPDLPEGPAEGTYPFHLPDRAQPWYRDRKRGPRTACCASITLDGNCSHVLIQEYEAPAPAIEISRPVQITDSCAGLFVVTGQTPQQLIEGLSTMEDFLSRTLGQASVASTAGQWLINHPPQPDHQLAVALILKPDHEHGQVLNQARRAITSGETDPLSKQVFFNSQPIGPDARIAMVYPGSGNHYLGMGRDLALHFPSIVNGMDHETEQLKTQFRPWNLMPWRRSWQPGWEQDAVSRLKVDPLNMIFGQVVFGDLMTRVLDRFSIHADAVIGYSLGESAALFAQGVWSDRGDMLDRMQSTDLFTTQLAGPCLALRRAWQVAEDEPVAWRVAVLNRPEKYVRETLTSIPRVRLLIVNSPNECVIGGLEQAVAQAVAAMDCQAVYLDGVVTVHCDAAGPVADAYRRLHVFPTLSKPGLDVYSCSWAAPYEVTSDRVADSIVKQAVDGFDFMQTIKHAYADGVRVFIEAGPRASCTRMIDQILIDQPHLAVAANQGNEDEIASLLRCLASLAADRVPVDFSSLYAGLESATAPTPVNTTKMVTVPVGGHLLYPTLPELPEEEKPCESIPPASEKSDVLPMMSESVQPMEELQSPPDNGPSSDGQWTQLLEATRQNMETTASVHEQFLDLSRELTRSFAETFDLQTRLLNLGARMEDDPPQGPSPPQVKPSQEQASPPAFDREMCMAFAIGSVGRVLGPAFDMVDTYRVRVRLPDEPLMLVDRIVSLEGEMLSMDSGRVVTEHDVLPEAWYLDGNRAPVCISVEAGQADLFLSAYLGIDHQVKGERAYRLLDAVVVFHRGLPRPGETVRYEITIDRFVRQGETWMFFFHFEGYIGGEHLISMRDGCAGFFTEAEVANSGGIILTRQECAPVPGKRPAGWRPPVPMTRESYSEDQVDALRRGDLAACFGRRFAGIGLSASLFLPEGRMRLIHRIIELDPEGGRYGLGLIRAEADIRPDDWFLVCHFVDDMVMPGTLMYECCAHTLRVFLQRMGWVTDKPGVCYEPVIGNAARLKCRGPVTPATRHVHYEIQISEIGYGPEPYAIADAHMSADGRPIVFFKDMSMKMTGIGREEIETVWRRQEIRAAMADEPTMAAALYDRASILAFAVGKPSEAFGEPYRIFDEGRKIARLPGPPYCFMDRVIQVEPAPWTLKADGWVTARYDIPEKEWYFAADRSGVMPFCVLLEIALQPCGWLAAYAGSALRSQRDLKFRNLGGSAVLHRQVTPGTGTLTMRCRMTKVSEAADMIIENFDYEVLAGDDPVYTGDTYFGFFSAEALNEQKGMGQTDPMVQSMLPYADKTDGAYTLSMAPPHTPESASGMAVSADELALPGKALMMIDRIDAHLPESGESGLGYIRGVKKVAPDEWFFKAHFHQDPVCPGSLGIESFLQLMKTVTMQRWPHLAATHRFRMVEGCRHGWTYRGQIVPKNQTIVVEALITHVTDGLSPSIRANGLLSVDSLPIYKMENFELALVSAADNS